MNEIRSTLIENPSIILDDPDLIHAIFHASDSDATGENVVDLRAVLMSRLRSQIDNASSETETLIETVQHLIVAMQSVHNAVLQILGAESLREFVTRVQYACQELEGVDHACLIIGRENADQLEDFHGAMRVVPMPVFYAYLGGNSTAPVLRRIADSLAIVDNYEFDYIGSEALIPLDYGHLGARGVLVLSSKDAQQFTPNHATDLLEFLGSVIETQLKKWLK